MCSTFQSHLFHIVNTFVQRIHMIFGLLEFWLDICPLRFLESLIWAIHLVDIVCVEVLNLGIGYVAFLVPLAKDFVFLFHGWKFGQEHFAVCCQKGRLSTGYEDLNFSDMVWSLAEWHCVYIIFIFKFNDRLIVFF